VFSVQCLVFGTALEFLVDEGSEVAVESVYDTPNLSSEF